MNSMLLRDINEHDCKLIYDWANEVGVRQYSLQSQDIPWNSHTAWFKNKISDPNCKMFVLEENGLPIGQIRFERDGDNNWLLGYSIDARFRGKGFGKLLLKLGLEEMDKDQHSKVVAYVKPDNLASIRVFKSLGFQEAGIVEVESIKVEKYVHG